ncbi:TPA: hypothetical protein N0F65_010203 [Lagenidium giganteum]|uniref:Uncharacterized protein n=1 Tax=Lagenidium giganteum TaxID=4803 RepID=A0AAV2YIM8_9STRA|nr:TPA: hypothetical protein N0F65_010203 [Lagenidium giganteum]
MFPRDPKKIKGNYYPAGVHSLAAARVFKHLSPTRGTSKYSSPTAFLLALREMDSVRFEETAPICVALYSCRLGSRGASITMFCEKSEPDVLRSGSFNANYNVDFGASTTLPPSPPCGSYNDLQDGIHGLTMMANDLWYDHTRKLLGFIKHTHNTLSVDASIERHLAPQTHMKKRVKHSNTTAHERTHQQQFWHHLTV